MNAETPTAKVAIYAVIKARFQYSDSAIKSIKPPTIKQINNKNKYIFYNNLVLSNTRIASSI